MPGFGAPGVLFSLPYVAVPDLEAALVRVKQLGGGVVHPGTRWAICKDSEGSPFGLAPLVRASLDWSDAAGRSAATLTGV